MKMQHGSRILVVVLLASITGCRAASVENGGSSGGNGSGLAGASGSSGGGQGTGGVIVSISPDAGTSSRPQDAACGDRCKVVVPFCGDGIINQKGEVCDDGNTKGGDGCTAACDQIEEGWVCPNQGQACLNIVRCGDKKVMGKETCDDGNTDDGDGCSSACQVEQGFVCPVVGATCRTLCGDRLQVGNEQ